MVDRVYLSPDERDVVSTLRAALVVPNDQWVVARLALARSLQLPESPDRNEFAPLAAQTGGVELHARQLTGEGREEEEFDYTDPYRAILSVYEGRDLFGSDAAFHEVLQRHVRRGLKVIAAEWQASGSIAQYIAQQLLFEASGSGTSMADAADPELPARIMRVLGELGVGSSLVAVDNGPRLTQLTLELHSYEDLERLKRGLEKISFALGLGQDTLGFALAHGEQRIHLVVPRPSTTWRVVSWSDVRGELETDAAREMVLPICVGTDVLGAPFLFDLATAPHLIVGGTTGSGKSMCLHALLLSILEGPRDAPELVLIDPKEVEFAAYERCSRVRGGVIRSADEALIMLESLVSVMDDRQERFRDLGARDFTEAKAKDRTLERIIVVIDELGDLVMQRREIETPLIRLAQKARSSGIHLVLATQRPEAATFPGLLRSNIPSRIALTVQKSSESRIILDETGAENLLMKGDMLIKLLGQPTVRAHGCRVDHADILAAVAVA